MLQLSVDATSIGAFIIMRTFYQEYLLQEWGGKGEGGGAY